MPHTSHTLHAVPHIHYMYYHHWCSNTVNWPLLVQCTHSLTHTHHARTHSSISPAWPLTTVNVTRSEVRGQQSASTHTHDTHTIHAVVSPLLDHWPMNSQCHVIRGQRSATSGREPRLTHMQASCNTTQRHPSPFPLVERFVLFPMISKHFILKYILIYYKRNN